MKLAAPKFWLIAALLIGACNHAGKKDDTTEKPPVLDDDDPVAINCNQPVTDRAISEETVWQWHHLWNLTVDAAHDSVRIPSDSLYRDIPKQALIDFLAPTYASQDTVVRIYFGSHDPASETFDPAPDLFVVVALPCTDDLTKVLHVSATGTEVISAEEAVPYINTYWTNLRNFPHWPNDIPDSILAFNFVRDSLLHPFQDPNIANARFLFGMHPVDTVNGKPSAELVFDLMVRFTNSAYEGQSLMDFARPCPELCDTASTLFKATSS